MDKQKKRKVSLGTIVMLIYTAFVLIGFALLLPSFTGSQDIFIDAQRLAVAMDDSLSQLGASTSQLLPQLSDPQHTIIPPFTSQTAPNASSTPNPPSPTPTVSPKRSFSLCAAGSIELNSDVRKALTINKQLRYDLLTDQLPQALKADLSIATLQNVISPSNKLSSVNVEAELLSALRFAGINTLNLSHTNAFNFGKAGFDETAASVRNAGMTPIGTSSTTLTINGVNVSVLHYQDKLSTTGGKQLTTSEKAQLLRPIDASIISSDIAAARNAGAQVVIITLWWGENGKDQPSAEQKTLAQDIANAGADIILGTGNGALQPVQVLSANRSDGKYHPVLCAYSLGNLFSPDRDSRVTLASILLKTNVVYDAATDTVAFENLTYTPTYAWRGKDNGKTIQRILINDPANLPSFVDANQQGVMDRCMTLVKTIMADTAIPMAQ